MLRNCCDELLGSYCLLKRSDCDEDRNEFCPYHLKSLKEKGILIEVPEHRHETINLNDVGLALRIRTAPDLERAWEMAWK